MQKRSSNVEKSPLWGRLGDVARAREGGIRPDVQRVLDLIDTTDPAWPGVAMVLREFTEAGIELDEPAVQMAVRLGRARWADGDTAKAAQASLATGAGSLVYYIRRGTLIKIGTTTRPRERFSDLMPDEILAVEPGGRQLETARHLQFAHLRLRPRGEYFRDAPEIRDHAKGIVALYGEPDAEWPNATPAPRKRWPLALSASTETITTGDAETRLGIKRDTIHAWVSRGRVHPAGQDERGRLLFYRDHLVQLRDAPRKRRRPSSLTAQATTP